MVRMLCDACKREVTREQVKASVIVAHEWGSRYPNLQGVLKTDLEFDVFCPDHLPWAMDYWTDKVLVYEKQLAVVASTLRNHCKEFFKKAGNESQTVSGKPEPFPERPQNEAAAGR